VTRPEPSEEGRPREAESAGADRADAESAAIPGDPGDEPVVVDVSALYAADGPAKLARLPAYEAAARERAGLGKVVKLTGPGPVWLYLRLAHALHGRARKLIYDSPVTGEVVIFDHDPR